MEIQHLPIAILSPHPQNYNRHPEAHIRELMDSLSMFDQFKNIVVCHGKILAGHGLVEAAKRKGMTHIYAVVRDDLTPEQQLALLVADNATPFLSIPDHDALQSLLAEIPHVDIPGVTDEWLASMAELGNNDVIDGMDENAREDDDILPEAAECIAAHGQTWQLGRHRLFCGDSMDAQNIIALVKHDRVDMVLTDPPYGMHLDTDFSGLYPSSNHYKVSVKSSSVYKPVMGDDDDFDPTFLFQAFPRVPEMFLFGANYFAERIPKKNAGSWLVWDKRAEGLESVKFSLSEFELCWSRAKHAQTILRYQWFGMCGLQNESDENVAGAPLRRIHPNQKPVRMLKYFIETWSPEGGVVVDLFGGSGSTLIACETLGRKCLMSEYDPAYVTAIIRRWEALTGQTAEKISEKGA